MAREAASHVTKSQRLQRDWRSYERASRKPMSKPLDHVPRWVANALSMTNCARTRAASRMAGEVRTPAA